MSPAKSPRPGKVLLSTWFIVRWAPNRVCCTDLGSASIYQLTREAQ